MKFIVGAIIATTLSLTASISAADPGDGYQCTQTVTVTCEEL